MMRLDGDITLKNMYFTAHVTSTYNFVTNKIKRPFVNACDHRMHDIRPCQIGFLLSVRVRVGFRVLNPIKKTILLVKFSLKLQCSGIQKKYNYTKTKTINIHVLPSTLWILARIDMLILHVLSYVYLYFVTDLQSILSQVCNSYVV